MRANSSFSSFNFRTGLLADLSDSRFPTRIHAITGKTTMPLSKNSTYYVYVYNGHVFHNSVFLIHRDMYACVTDGYLESHNEAMVLVIERIGFKGMITYGGPIEEEGRLKYIDGCTDSLLVPPVKLGDPCLNHLHFPSGIDQTMHTHPSVRVGIIAGGRGWCITPFGVVPLRPGMVFVIHEEDGSEAVGLDGEMHKVGSHCFRTDDIGMEVVAWHPDSDFGPTDEEHPMISRTFVDGVSAKYIDSIKTK